MKCMNGHTMELQHVCEQCEQCGERMAAEAELAEVSAESGEYFSRIEVLKDELADTRASVSRWGELLGDPIGAAFGALDEAIIQAVNELADTKARLGNVTRTASQAMEYIRCAPDASFGRNEAYALAESIINAAEGE